MKKIICCLSIIIITHYSHAQDAGVFWNVSKDSARLFADQVANLIDPESTFETISAKPNQKYILFKYKNADKTTVYIWFKDWDGRLYFDNVEGNFEGTYRVWTKFFRPEQDITSAKVGNSKRVLFLDAPQQPQALYWKVGDDYKIFTQ